ncbi:hypothetical protein TSUD_339210 [Trifolium subterraneum]|nr:hypothetical protein TSUD_339210 [Trifolium subterraneum]
MPFGSVEDGQKYYGALFFTMLNMMFNCASEQATLVDRLPVFYKQRDFMFFPAWTFGFPMWFLRIPLSFIEPTIWVLLTYYPIGFSPSPSRFFRHYLVCVSIHNMALGLFRLVGSVGRTQVLANILAGLTYQLVFVLGGFIVAKNDIKPWMLWGYYVSPMSYGQNAIVINEFLDERWSKPNTDPRFNATTVGELLLKARGFYTQDYWFWICIGALFGFSLLFNSLFILAITYLNPIDGSNAFIEDVGDKKDESSSEISSLNEERKTGMVLPFQPLSLAFSHLNYYVDMPVAIAGVPKIKVGYNPAAWMLEISSPSAEAQLGVDFAEIYANSTLYR